MMTLNRREFCATAAVAAFAGRTYPAWAADKSHAYQMVAKTDRGRILQAAKLYLPMEPVTITAFLSPRSPGGPHDFFSQADYFWPNPKNPDGPYINRDGQSNPENFIDHRKVMIDLSVRMPSLTAAWLLTKDRRYARRSGDHLRAWFVAPETRMKPNLEFSQGVHGVSTGRNYGIIDTLHLVEVARAASFLGTEALSAADQQSVKQWFREYLGWMKSSEKGKQERATLNNHATCWALQASEFARLIGDEGTRDEIRVWFTTKLLPDQLGMDGSFPKELVRTKPYSYSIFNFDVMAGLAQSLKGSGIDLTTFSLSDGRGLCKAAEFLYPFLKDKDKWPYAKDVEHFDALPVRSPGLLFSGLACHRAEYVSLWKTLNPDPTDKEIIRNYPIRQPLLWV
ncbi:alginate lyase family protein [Granulicella sp. S190]|uniref:alginate lyase family protein n=1 Tax=Granulicella sp. S190 TaxID=1747226 RepID=UPI00131B8D3A|nr:alginate lyase family protein [Granulicella sp. S190]